MRPEANWRRRPLLDPLCFLELRDTATSRVADSILNWFEA